jgi:phosphoribosyl-AMP cyclohydrolase
MDLTPDFQKAGGLIPAIAQDAETGLVLMMAWMNHEAWQETVRTKRAVYFSRSRNKLWRKGEESGHVQEVRDIYRSFARRKWPAMSRLGRWIAA